VIHQSPTLYPVNHHVVSSGLLIADQETRLWNLLALTISGRSSEQGYSDSIFDSVSPGSLSIREPSSSVRISRGGAVAWVLICSVNPSEVVTEQRYLLSLDSLLRCALLRPPGAH
jgi:hypothetical protein